jgi:carbonic anhydrase
MLYIISRMISGQAALKRTLEELSGRAETSSRNLRSIVTRVRPSVEAVLSGHPTADLSVLMQAAIRANVRASANHLRHGSELLERLIAEEGLVVVGAEYSLETGIVTFFDGVDDVDD